MPYLKHDQPGPGHPLGYQRHDSYPLADRHYGGNVAANDYDFYDKGSYGVMRPGGGDGYDVYRVGGGYVSGSGTRDGGGYRQTFFDSGCVPWNGWVFFPAPFLHQFAPGASGSGVFPIHGDYYEQNGEPYPGSCGAATGFVKNTLTTWTFEQGYPFGGINGAPVKRIDAIVSTHGFPTSGGPYQHIGLERFYFTDLYGVTRWEAWEAHAAVSQTFRCQGPTEMVYQGVIFTLEDCHDWSAVTVYSTPQPRFAWPYPEANVLANSHFDGLQGWQYNSAALNAGVLTSTTALDIAHSQNGHGVDYLQVNCAGQCWSGQAVFQDVPISAVQAGQQIDYGFSGVVVGSAGANMYVTLSLQDAQGAQLWSTSFDAAVPTNSNGVTPSTSIYSASSVFLATSPPLPSLSSAAALRLSLSPTAPVVYDILDASMMPRTGPRVSAVSSSP